MSELKNLLAQLKAQSDVFHSLTIGKIIQFVACAARLKDDIILTQPANISASQAPDHLPPSIKHFLGQACDIPENYTDACWNAFKDTVWNEGSSLQDGTEHHIRRHGYGLGISMYIFTLSMH
jgi:hypothetical protein